MTPSQRTPTDSKAKTNRRWQTQIGIALITLSGVFWFSIFAVPFTSLATAHKAVLAGVLFGAVQVFWWTGAALVGPSAIASIKARLTRK